MTAQLKQQPILAVIEKFTGTPVTTAVIWLHGLGADGNDFANIVPELQLPADNGVKFIFPHAPIRPVTINQGMPMRAWYDITSLTRFEDDIAGIEQSCAAVTQLISQQLDAGITAKRIILAGFSQGGAIALHAALRHKQALGGVLALSTYLPAVSYLPAPTEDKKQMPILMAHGDFDDVIPVKIAELARDILVRDGYPVEWRHYPMAHQVCGPEIADIRRWLVARL